MRSNEAKTYQKELMATGKTKAEAKELIQDYAKGRAAGKTRKFYQRSKKKADRNSDKTLAMTEALGYKKYQTAKQLRQNFKKRDEAKQELKNAEKIFGKKFDNKSRQEWLARRTKEKSSIRVFGSKKTQTRKRKEIENRIHKDMINKNPGMAERVGNKAFSFGKSERIQSKIDKARALGLSNNISTRAAIYKGSKRKLFETNRSRALKENRKKFSKELVGKETTNIEAFARRSNKRTAEARNIMTTFKNRPRYAEALKNMKGFQNVGKDITFDQARQLAVDGKKGDIKRAGKMFTAAEKKTIKAMDKLGIKNTASPEAQQLQKIAFYEQLYKSGQKKKTDYKKSKAESLGQIQKSMMKNQMNKMNLAQSNLNQSKIKTTSQLKKMIKKGENTSAQIEKQEQKQIKKLQKEGLNETQARNLAEKSSTFKKLEARKDFVKKYGTNIKQSVNESLLSSKKKVKAGIKSNIKTAKKEIQKRERVEKQLKKEEQERQRQEEKQRLQEQQRLKEQEQQRLQEEEQSKQQQTKPANEQLKTKADQKKDAKALKKAKEEAQKEAQRLEAEAKRNEIQKQSETLLKKVSQGEYKQRLAESTGKNISGKSVQAFKNQVNSNRQNRKKIRKKERDKMSRINRLTTRNLNSKLNNRFYRERLNQQNQQPNNGAANTNPTPPNNGAAITNPPSQNTEVANTNLTSRNTKARVPNSS